MGNSIDKEQARVEKVKSKLYQCMFKAQILSDEDRTSIISHDVVLQLNRSKLKCKFSDNRSMEFDVRTDVTVVKQKIEKCTLKLRVRISGTNSIWKIEAPNIKSFMEWKEALMLSKRPSWLMSPVCQICVRKFCPVHRCHHCRYCGKALCNPCSKLRAKIEVYDYKQPQRICNPCASRLVIEHGNLIKTSRLKRTHATSCFTATPTVSEVAEGRLTRASSAVYNNLVDYVK
jgi:hypothetical protein